MKKIVYIGAFVVLGFLLSMIVHAALEIPALAFVSGNFEAEGASFVWRYWWLFHGVGGKVLLLFGLVGGVYGREKVLADTVCRSTVRHPALVIHITYELRNVAPHRVLCSHEHHGVFGDALGQGAIT